VFSSAIAYSDTWIDRATIETIEMTVFNRCEYAVELFNRLAQT
jgi:hypothetical protein